MEMSRVADGKWERQGKEATNPWRNNGLGLVILWKEDRRSVSVIAITPLIESRIFQLIESVVASFMFSLPQKSHVLCLYASITHHSLLCQPDGV